MSSHPDARASRSPRKLLLLTLILLSAAAATDVFAGVLAGDGLSNLDLAILAIFFVSFAWISSAFWTAIAGFCVGWGGRGSGLCETVGELPTTTRTALVMPIHHEDPEQVGIRIAAIYRSSRTPGSCPISNCSS